MTLICMIWPCAHSNNVQEDELRAAKDMYMSSLATIEEALATDLDNAILIRQVQNF